MASVVSVLENYKTYDQLIIEALDSKDPKGLKEQQRINDKAQTFWQIIAQGQKWLKKKTKIVFSSFAFLL